ncbi:MAG: hypothetical protein ACT4P1_03740, partial [Sporichthyaceae bacterium]
GRDCIDGKIVTGCIAAGAAAAATAVPFLGTANGGKSVLRQGLKGLGKLFGGGSTNAAKTVAARATVEAGKWDYLFGRVASNSHNTARSAENATQLRRLGVYDNPEGRALLQSHFDEVLRTDSNIVTTFSNKYGTFQVRDSVFAGPGGYARFETTWQVTGDGHRLTTLIPFGGP